MSRILLIRHGETEGESSIRYFGATDVPLSDVGRGQMRAARRRLPDEAIDLVVTSPLTRAWEGARIVCPQGPILLEDGFREIDFGRWGSLTPRWDFSWVDDVYYDPSEGRGTLDVFGVASKPPFTVGQAAYWLHDFRLTYQDASGSFEVAGWCRNLNDERYKNFAFDASRFGGVVINFVGDPRTCGAEVGFTW